MHGPGTIVLVMISSSGLFHRKFKGFPPKIAALLLLMGPSVLPVGAQVQTGGNGPVTSGPSKTFDAASVRPSSPGVKGLDFLDPVSNAPPPPGGLFLWNVQIAWLIDFAYDLRGSLLRQQAFDGLPKQMHSMAAGWYAIEARAEGNPTREDVRQMVRSLLEDRFQYSAHLEKRDGQIYALEVAKAGLGLRPHTEGAPCALSPSQTDENRYRPRYASCTCDRETRSLT